MRCKNCGLENEDNRYICSNCGSPLYDEDEQTADESIDSYNNYPEDENDNNDDDDSAKKKQIAAIVIAVIVVIAVAAGIIFGAVSSKSNKETTTESTTVSTTKEETTTKPKKVTTTKETTTKETTTEESTTKETTTKETTTAETTYRVYIDIDGNGTVTGDGEYVKGKRATLVATADDGYQFDGWYDSNGTLVASGTKYSITVKSDTTLTARFKAIEGEIQ